MRKHFEHSVSQHLFGCQKSMLELDGVLYASGFMSRFHQRGLGLPHGLPEHIFWFPIRRHNSTSLTPERTTSAAVKCNFLRENFACPVKFPSGSWILDCTGPGEAGPREWTGDHGLGPGSITLARSSGTAVGRCLGFPSRTASRPSVS